MPVYVDIPTEYGKTWLKDLVTGNASICLELDQELKTDNHKDYFNKADYVVSISTRSIVEFDEKKLAYSIKGLIENDMLRTVYSNNLKEENKNINYNAERYLELMREGQERAW